MQTTLQLLSSCTRKETPQNRAPSTSMTRLGSEGESGPKHAKGLNIYLSRHTRLQNGRLENTLGRVAAPYLPSGENWSLSNTVMQSTSCSRSLIKNWQLEFHFGLRVSCIVLVMWH